MGCCLSKNDPCSNSNSQIQETNAKPSVPVSVPVPVKLELPKKQSAAFELEAASPKAAECSTEEKESEEKESLPKKKKEVFVIQHRKSNEKRPDSDGSASNSSNSSDPNRGSGSEEMGRNILAAAANGQAVRTSSCTKEEVDAILIQCGRLSRSSSGKGNGNGNGNGHGRRYSGSKRSFDFDRENDIVDDSRRLGNEEELNEEDERSRRRQSRGSNRRRTTPSRSRERDRQQQQQQQRSGSKERSHSNGRRVSRSPGRRSESPVTVPNTGNGNGKPGKLVSVPATVGSLTVGEKGSVGNGNDGNVKRVLVKRNVGSPRSQSPARAISPARANSPGRGGNQGNGGGGQQQPVSAPLSRNGSRKAEHSPFRRTPLNEIDINSLPFHPLSNKRPVSKGKEIEEDVVVKQPINSAFQQNKYAETNNFKASVQGTHRRSRSRGAEGYEVTKTNYCRVNEFQTPNVEQMTEDKRGQLDTVEYDAMVTPVVVSGAETLKLPQTLMRSRSARRSRDLDISVEALLAPTPATDYNSLLLRDIQNFHQKKSSNANANANVTTAATPTANANVSSNNNAGSSNVDSSSTYKLPPCVSKACSIVEAVADLNSTTGSDDRWKTPKETNFSYSSTKTKDPYVESEVKVGDDLMEPSLHKYVTVRMKGGDFNDDESSGSNSYVGGSQQNWLSSSTWEPTSADSTESWTSKSYSREEMNPARFQRHGMSEIACGINEEPEKKISNGGAARVRTIASRGPTASTSKAAAASM